MKATGIQDRRSRCNELSRFLAPAALMSVISDPSRSISLSSKCGNSLSTKVRHEVRGQPGESQLKVLIRSEVERLDVRINSN
jgi:hypothetical protein